MKFSQVMEELKAFGSPSTRKTYARHGIVGSIFGVKHGDLHKLVRKIEIDHPLALELWHSGNFDAQILATMIMDPAQLKMKDLAELHKDVDGHALSSALSNVAQRTPVAEKMMRKWMTRKSELYTNTAWMMLAGIARESPDLLKKSDYADFLKTMEENIHQAPNRTRHAMNSALISIGTYINEKSALRSAKRIGVVEVDHGDTSCKTKPAGAYIQKAAAHHRAKLAKLAKV